MNKCLNCNNTITGNFCLQCGQKADIKRYSLKYFFNEAFSSIVDFDSDFIRTFKSLVIKPGKFIHNYLAGKRKNYNSPFKYLFIVLILNFAVSFILDKPPFEPVKITGVENRQFLNQLITLLTNLVIILGMVPLAFGIMITNKKENFYFLEYFIFMIYIISQSILIFTLIHLLLYAFEINLPELVNAVLWLGVFSLIYFLSYITFFNAVKKNKFLSFVFSYSVGLLILIVPLAVTGIIINNVSK